MTHFSFKKWNRTLAWISFFVALLTYVLTLAPTVSFWDCGEYISASSNLGIAHPPGAPLFQMLGAFISSLSFGNNELIALLINSLSALSSAFTIYFLFLTISLLAKSIVSGKKEPNKKEAKSIFGTALLGSLSFAFTDSFWFNAVETEVYAMASLSLAILFWLGLKWEENINKPRGNKWLLLIAFVAGLSFGIHFMSLLAIPAIVLLYLFKDKKEFSFKKFVVYNVIAVSVLLIVFKGLLPNVLAFFSWIELIAVNSFGMPFNSGTIIASIVLISLLIGFITYTHKKKWVWVNTLSLCLVFICIGFSSWLLIPIRANSQTTLNTNNPNNARDLIAYYNLEQYGERPLLYGANFTNKYAELDSISPYKDDKIKYEKDEKLSKYVVVNDYKNALYNKNSEHNVFLPRMWEERNALGYLQFINLKVNIKSKYAHKKEIRQLVNQFNNDVETGSIDATSKEQFLNKFGQYVNVEKPTFLENISFLFNYQIGYMYWRYFMWNFSGRQDDIQGEYNYHGEWLSGFNFLDSKIVGLSQSNLPNDQLLNKARNNYYMIPLLLGIIGLIFVAKQDRKLFWVLLVLFLFTGIAIQFYTNVKPFEPRERDYVLVGSFYVFSIFIGFSFISLLQASKKLVKSKLQYSLPVICLVCVPLLLAHQNWDDHNRTGRETARAMAKAYLDSCKENAILFTSGDIDTYPLWYLQEVEGYRRDVKVIVNTYFAADWYIDQMKKKTFESDPIPSQLTHDKYKWGTRDVLYYYERTKDSIDLKTFLNFLALDKEEVMVEMKSGQKHNTFPTKNVHLNIDKEVIINKGIVDVKHQDKIVSSMQLNIDTEAIGKQHLLMLDILANNNWERPIQFTGLSNDNADYIWLQDYLQFNGMTYQLVPVKTENSDYHKGFVNTNEAYQQINNWEWGGSNNEKVYLDPVTRRNSIRFRDSMSRVAEQLIKENKPNKAQKIIDLSIDKMPIDKFGYESFAIPFIEQYYQINQKEKAQKIYKEITNIYKDHIDYYLTLTPNEQAKIVDRIWRDMVNYKNCIHIAVEQNDSRLIRNEIPILLNYLEPFTDIINANSSGVNLTVLIEGLYKSNSVNNARKLYNQEVDRLQKSLIYASKLDEQEAYYYAEEILQDIEKYKEQLRLIHKYDTENFFVKEKETFNDLIDKLENFFSNLNE